MSIPGIQKLRQEQAKRFRWTRGRLFLASLLVFFVLYVGLGFWVAPLVARSQLEKRLSAVLDRPVNADKVRVNPLTLSVAVEGFSIAERDGSPFAGWRRLFINFDSSSFAAREWRFEAIDLEGLRARLRVGQDGKLNVDDVIQRLKGMQQKDDSAKDAPWPLSVARLHLISDPIEYEDQSRPTPFKTAINPVDFTIYRFHTSASALADGSFTAQTDEGERFAWRGTVSLAPLQSSGELEVQDIPLGKYAAYYSHLLVPSVSAGTVSAKIKYEVSIPQERLVLALSEGSVSLQGLELKAGADAEPELRLDSVKLEGLRGSTAENRFSAHSVEVGPGHARVIRDKDGLSVTRWLKPAASEQTPAGSSMASPQFSVEQINMKGIGIHTTDTTSARPVVLNVSSLALSVGAFDSVSLDKFLPVRVEAQVQERGSVAMNGEVALKPLQWRVNGSVTALPLAGMSPLLEASSPYALTQGNLDFQGESTGRLTPGDEPVIGAKGNLALAELNVVDKAHHQSLASVGRLGLDRIEYVSQPSKRLVVALVSLENFVVDAAIRSDGSLNVVPAKDPGETTPSEAGPPAPLPLSVAVDKVAIANGAIRFRDQSIKPEVQAGLEQLGGTIEGLSSEELARAKVDLAGKLQGASSLAISGQINPLSETAYTDLTVKMQGMDLSPFAPYIGKYAGRELSRGSANADLNIHLSSRELDSKNVLVLDQFTLGQSTNSKDATTLPVGLALALLRDRQGKILVDLPIQGRLDDPEFKLGRVIGRVFVNILTKTATSPFSLIGGMFGGGSGQSGDDLKFQDFALGQSTLDEDDVKELEVVAKALIERPGLALDVTGSFDPVQDANALREVFLRDQLKGALLEEMRAGAPPGAPVPSEAPELTPEGEARLLTKLYLAEGGERPSVTQPLPSTDSEAPEVEPKTDESKNWIQRFFGFLSGRNTGTAPRASGPPTHQSTSAAAAVARSVPPPDEIRGSLLARINVDQVALKDLASRRATEVRAFLVSQGKAPADRIFIAPPVNEGPRVRLDLK